MKIAITGSTGSGKSTVCDYIRSKGYYVFDADKVNKELLKKGNLGYAEVFKVFPEVFDGEELNKAKLANIVFSDENKKKLLESILHPMILKEMEKKALEYEPFFAEIPLLFETGWDIYFDTNVLVVADESLTLDRLILRGMSKKDAKRRIALQMPVDIKISKADEIIYNNSDLASLYKKTDKVLEKYVR